MKPDILPVISPAEAMLMLAFAKLVEHLDKLGVISRGDLAEVLAAQADAVPPQCRLILESIAEGMRPTSSRLRVLIREENENE